MWRRYGPSRSWCSDVASLDGTVRLGKVGDVPCDCRGQEGRASPNGSVDTAESGAGKYQPRTGESGHGAEGRHGPRQPVWDERRESADEIAGVGHVDSGYPRSPVVLRPVSLVVSRRLDATTVAPRAADYAPAS